MKKIVVATVATAVAFSAVSTYTVSAASYKIVKNKLVNAKTKKAVKGTVAYKNKLYKNGALVKGTTVHKKKLYVNGSLAKGTKVYKSKLYVKGALAKGKVLFNKKLYEDGEVAYGIVKFDGKFYDNGKLIGKDKLFEYNEKLYKNNALAKGFNVHYDTLYKDGIIYTGVYNNTYYSYGYPYFDSKPKTPYNLHDSNTTFSTDYTKIFYSFDIAVSEKIPLTKNDIQVSNGLVVDSVDHKYKKMDGYEVNKYVITFSKAKKNEEYDLTINNIKIAGHNFPYTTKITGYKDVFNKKSKYMAAGVFAKATAYYEKYKNYSESQLEKLRASKEGMTLFDFVQDNMSVTYLDNSEEYKPESLTYVQYSIISNLQSLIYGEDDAYDVLE